MTDLDHLTAVANHPAVRPWLLGPPGWMDLRHFARVEGVVTLSSAHGGFLAYPLGEGRYDVHALFTPEREAGEVVTLMRKGLDLMFSEVGAVELLAYCPAGHRALVGLLRLARFHRGQHIWSLSSADYWRQHPCL